MTGLANWAVRAETGGGRDHTEAVDPLRTPFELDAYRIIESTAFRRLEHKTQLFASGAHDHFRTRLTHTLEVAEIATTLARLLRANADLTRAIALAHDLGHPPFGHAGEAALDRLMRATGGFNHNTHSLRVVEYLEHPVPRFRGLNLTHATRAGMQAHATPYDVPGAPDSDADATALAGVEAQIVDLADRIAYNCHDLEDATGAGLVELAELRQLTLWQVGERFARAAGAPPDAHVHAIRRPVLDGILHHVLVDIVQASTPQLADLPSVAAVAQQPGPVVAPSAGVQAQLEAFEAFLRRHVFRHPLVAEADARGQWLIESLFAAYRADPTRLPERFRQRVDEQGLDRVIGDYLAGMTDRFCVAECERYGGRSC